MTGSWNTHRHIRVRWCPVSVRTRRAGLMVLPSVFDVLVRGQAIHQDAEVMAERALTAADAVH